MVVRHNIAALGIHRNMMIHSRNVSKHLERLSSGYRINRAGDDAAGLAISEKMRGQIRGLSMAEQNVSNAINMIQTAEGGLQEIHAILQRMRELAVQAANGTYDDNDRANLQMEIEQLVEEITRIAKATEYNGMPLLDGSFQQQTPTPANPRDEGLWFQIGANGGLDALVRVFIDDMSAGNLGDVVAGVFLTDIDISDPGDANAAIDVIAKATSQVSRQRAQLGAVQNRLEHTLNNLATTKENLIASESTIRDADMAQEMMEYTKHSILLQAAQAMLAQAVHLPESLLELLWTM